MKKTLAFFKLRMKQLKSDKTGLFFSYVFPVLLLLGIGYPLEMMGGMGIKVSYIESELDADQRKLVGVLSKHEMVDAVVYPGTRIEAERALENNEIQHLLKFDPESTAKKPDFDLYSNSLEENKVAAFALSDILRSTVARNGGMAQIRQHSVVVSKSSSYLAVLLPGVIGMTLLIIGLGGFGAVLIEEEHQGVFQNLKTIDISPVPFVSGLFLSRMLVAYTVAIAMFAISVVVFSIPAMINFPLLMLVVTLGSTTFLGMGLMVSSFSPSVVAFNGIVNVLQLPLVILGGVFFSITAFPQWLQTAAGTLPLTQFNSALRDLMFSGVGFHNASELYPELIGLAIWSAVTLLLARWKFRW